MRSNWIATLMIIVAFAAAAAVKVGAFGSCHRYKKSDQLAAEQAALKDKLEADRGDTRVGTGMDLKCQLDFATTRLDALDDASADELTTKVKVAIGMTDAQGRPTADMKAMIATCNAFDRGHGAWLASVHDAPAARAFIEAHLADVK